MRERYTPLVPAFLLLTFSPPALAYIDPGSLSVALQVVVAGVAGAVYVGRNVLSLALSKLLGKKSAEDINPVSPPQHPDD